MVQSNDQISNLMFSLADNNIITFVFISFTDLYA